VIHLKHAAPRAVLVIGILGVAAAATAMWQQYAPKGVCLYCATPEHYQTALNVPPKAPTATSGDVKHHSGLALPPKPSILPEMTTAPASHDDGAAEHADAPDHWQPWGQDENEKENEQEPGEPGVGDLRIGKSQLRRMISTGHFAEPDGGIASAAPRTSHENHSEGESQSGPDEGRPVVEQPGTPGSNSPNPSSGHAPNPGSSSVPQGPVMPPVATTTPPSGGATPAAAPPTNPFVEHTTPPSNPFAPPAAVLSPGTPGGTVSSPRSSPAANPEPASVLLIGTGLAAVLNQLRRRRAR